MAKFGKKQKKGLPPISTASLPDIVFMLLFFFMVTTVVRENPAKVKYVVPTTKYYDQVEDRSKIAYVYIGTLGDGGKSNIRYEINGNVVDEIVKLKDKLINKQGEMGEKMEDITFTLKIDKSNVDVGQIKRLKKMMQEIDIKLILYSSEQEK